MKTFGDTLKAILEERGMEQKELCELTGENSAYISRVVGGKVKDPSFAKACSICDALGMPVDEFLSLQREGEEADEGGPEQR